MRTIARDLRHPKIWRRGERRKEKGETIKKRARVVRRTHQPPTTSNSTHKHHLVHHSNKKKITTMKFNKRRTHTLVPFIVLSCFSLFVTKIPRRSNTRKHATSTLRSVEPSLLDGLLRAAWRRVIPSESTTSGMTPLSRSSSRISMRVACRENNREGPTCASNGHPKIQINTSLHTQLEKTQTLVDGACLASIFCCSGSNNNEEWQRGEIHD